MAREAYLVVEASMAAFYSDPILWAGNLYEDVTVDVARVSVPMVTCVSLYRKAAEDAGFKVLRLIHEPTAAVLAYGIGQDSPSGKRYKHHSIPFHHTGSVLPRSVNCCFYFLYLVIIVSI